MKIASSSHATCGKKAFLIPLLLVLSLAVALAAATETAYAKPDKNSQIALPHFGAYTGPGPSLVTVSQVSSMPNKVWVTLKGSISQALDYKYYMFTDSSGTILVKIDPMAWLGQQISASDSVEIYGKVKRDKRNWEHVRVDVKRIMKQ